jgi:hypothetical protein
MFHIPVSSSEEEHSHRSLVVAASRICGGFRALHLNPSQNMQKKPEMRPKKIPMLTKKRKLQRKPEIISVRQRIGPLYSFTIKERLQ